MKGLKVVTPDEMVRLEALAVSSGLTAEGFMQQAGLRVAEAAEEWIERHQWPKQVTLLAWKGNKAGDAFVAGLALLAAGYTVHAVHLAPLQSCSPLCQKFAEKFRKKGGLFTETLRGLLIDGLLGTGFTGPVSVELKRLILQANASGLPILAIDIPSGLNGTSGETGGAVIAARLTLTLGLPKIGLFLRDGWNCVGELSVVDCGLPASLLEQAEPIAYLPDDEALKEALPKIIRNRHKYEVGSVVGYAGSCRYSGAAKLSSLAALRGGAGIVHLFYPPAAQAEMASMPYEIVHIPWNQADWTEALQKAKAVFIGPGLGSNAAVEQLVEHLALPVVLDADALQPSVPLPSVSICTPHRGEMLRLLGQGKLEEPELFAETQRYCDRKHTVIVLKGAPTWVFAPHSKPFLIVRGDPGMATAGSGDVLTGLLASLLAQGCGAIEAAVLGTTLHGLAGESAARERTSHSLIASDLIHHFSQAFRYFD